ncbi:hypothetical protein ABIF91_001392 [Bradyrhizobium sp. USDA 241]
MNEHSNIVPLRQPDEIDDPLTNILRSGARQLLAQAVEMEAEAFLAAMKGLKLPDGRDRLVRHGHGPVRTIQTGIGAVEVARVKIVNGTRGPRSHGLGADGLRTALEAYRHPELPEGLDGCWNVAPGVLDDGLRSQRAPGRG